MKRLLDVVASATGLALLGLPMLIVAFVVRLDSPGPALYRQIRVGKGGHEFEILKFRTMHVASESSGRLTVGNDPRITRVGGVLRMYKIDELPQLINVFLGQMSLVGPRPEVPEYAHLLPGQERVWSVRPGITDPISVVLRNESALLEQAADPDAYYREVLLPRKTAAYLDYIDRQSLQYDIGIILRTLWKVVRTPEGEQEDEPSVP